MRKMIFTMALLSSFSLQALAETDREEIKTILEGIVTGWEQADGTHFRKNFLDYDGARYIESGGQ